MLGSIGTPYSLTLFFCCHPSYLRRRTADPKAFEDVSINNITTTHKKGNVFPWIPTFITQHNIFESSYTYSRKMRGAIRETIACCMVAVVVVRSTSLGYVIRRKAKPQDTHNTQHTTHNMFLTPPENER